MVPFQLGTILLLEDTLCPSSGGFMACQWRMYMIDIFPFLFKYKPKPFQHITNLGERIAPHFASSQLKEMFFSVWLADLKCLRLRGKKNDIYNMLGPFMFLCSLCALMFHSTLLICWTFCQQLKIQWVTLRVSQWSAECYFCIHAVTFGADWNVCPAAGCQLQSVGFKCCCVYISLCVIRPLTICTCEISQVLAVGFFCWTRPLPRMYKIHQLCVNREYKWTCILI